MSTQAATIGHILDTLSALPLEARKMFGEYGVYLDGKVVALVCDDTFFIKPTLGALALLPGVTLGPAYKGAKDFIIGSELLDDPDLCVQVLRHVAAEVPTPKPKSPKRTKGKA